ncbi:MAG TPA: hypothetical protein VIU12_31800 [Chryseolinea sp.]
MKRIFLFIALMASAPALAQPNPEAAAFKGDKLFGTVTHYASLGEHRTGTPADFATSEWLGKELAASGYTVKYYEFSLKQFFPEAVSVTDAKKRALKAFPFWYVSDSIKLDVEGALTGRTTAVKDKVVVLNFTSSQPGQSGEQLLQKLSELIAAGAKAVIGYTESEAGEIAALNTPKAAQPWKAPVVLVSPSDARQLLAQEGQTVKVSIKGTFKQVTARNVYGTIGNGDQYVVVSTPISGWFGCGGERGPGVATWLALAQWAAAAKLPYTFVFTGNSGHELGGWGAKAFLDGGAPPVDKTKLWVHLGAGIATLAWKSTPSGLVKENKVDVNRNFFYSNSVATSFQAAFKNVQGNKWTTTQRVGGELIYVIDKGYPNVAGAAYSHPYFHMKSDDASKTSPAILEEVAVAFRNFIESQIRPQ